LYKTQQSLIISNKMAAVEASACTSLLALFLTVCTSQLTLQVKAVSLFIFNYIDDNPTSHRKVVLNDAKILVFLIDFAC